MPRRLRFQFSLRTLVFSALLIGSSAALWRNWCPWQRTFWVDHPGARSAVYFSDDDRYIAFHRGDTLEVRALNGERHALFSNLGSDSVIIAGPYAALYKSSASIPKLYNWLEARELDLQAQLKRNVPLEHFDLRKNRILLAFADKTVICRLPDFALEWESDGNSGARLLSNGRLMTWSLHAFEIKDLDTNTVVYKSHAFPSVTDEWERLAMKRNILGINTCDGAFACYHINLDNGKIYYHEFCRLIDFTPDGQYALIGNRDIHGAFTGAALIRFPDWKKIKGFPDLSEPRFNKDGSLLLDPIHYHVYDTATGRALWSSADFDIRTFSDNGKLVMAHTFGSAKFRDAISGALVFEIPSTQFPEKYENYPDIFWAQKSNHFAVYSRVTVPSKDPELAPLPGPQRVSVFRQYRPWQWYGPAWLPEFWLTLLFAAGFVRSVIMDRRHR